MTTLDPSQGIALITDGSAYTRDRSGGWAWVAVDAFEGLDKDSGYRADTTISQMELMAPAKGLERMFELYGSCNVLIYSDSQYVVLGATDKTRKRHKNKQFWRALDEAIAKHDYVEFTHVYGHNDHFYNEMADDLAGKARRNGVKA